jgi:mRNA-degrading endonuclease RelE of RelBE toxin-antitoxin system
VVLEAFFGSIAEDPQRAGKPLRVELEGRTQLTEGRSRLIYEVDEAARVVLVHSP